MLPNYSPRKLAFYANLGRLLVCLAWILQMLNVSWQSVQPNRSLRLLIVFTLLALSLVLLSLVLKQTSWDRRDSLLLDLNFVFTIYAGLLLLLPRALDAAALASPSGRAGLICTVAGLMLAYFPPKDVHAFHMSWVKGNPPLIQRLLINQGRILLGLGIVAQLLGARMG